MANLLNFFFRVHWLSEKLPLLEPFKREIYLVDTHYITGQIIATSQDKKNKPPKGSE